LRQILFKLGASAAVATLIYPGCQLQSEGRDC
jgi:hypothetical protein